MSPVTSKLAWRPMAGGRAAGSGGRSRALTGARELARLAFRRDRVLLPVWVYALTAISASLLGSINLLFCTPLVLGM